MPTKPSAPRKISTSNTKQEMLAAYNELLKQMEEQKAAESRPQEMIEQRATAEAVRVAEELSTEGVVKQVGELRANIGRLLSQVSSQLEEQVDKYAQISKAIQFKEKELAEIYEIQKSALSLAALLQAQQTKRDEFEFEMQQRREQLITEIETARGEWDVERKQHEAEIKERDAAEAKRRKREEEEYRYAFAREQQIAKDRGADEQAKIEREFAARQQQLERQLAEREQQVAAREQELADLRARVDAFPAQLDAAVQKAAKDTTARLQAEFASKEELFRRDFAGERNVLTTRIEAMQRTISEQAEQIARLSQQSDKAYAQVQEIAVKALEGPAAFKSPLAFQQPPMPEPARRQPEK